MHNDRLDMNNVTGDQELPLLEHVRELRQRMLIVVAALIIVLMGTFPFTGDLIGTMWAYLFPPEIEMVIYSPMEWMLTRLVLSLAIAIAFVFPLFMYEFFAFVQKGLFPNEKRFTLFVVPPSMFLFLTGMGVAFFIVIPLIFNYMFHYSEDVATSGISVRDTFSLITTLMIMFGLLFQLPMIMVISIKSGLVKADQLKDKRVVVYGILIGFAIFIAPDITGMSQLITAFFLVLLFEFSLLISRYV
ncbi:MAG: twin-arginine translocase subunit TatC [Methanosarcinales archaeon]|nr:twin-arginine translocase subunit TatC [Methanosarcinales archaeon]